MLRIQSFKISSFCFNILLACFLFFSYNFLFFKRIYAVSQSISVTIHIIISIFALLFAIINIIMCKYTSKFFAIAFCLFNSVVFYFMLTYGFAIDGIMLLNILGTDPAEVEDIINYTLISYILLLGVFPSVVIYKTKIYYKPIHKEIKIRAISIAICLCIAISVMFPNLQFTMYALRKNKNLKNFLLPVNYIGAVISATKMLNFTIPDFINIAEDAHFTPYWDNGKKNLFVVIVGETARAANFSLGGYEKHTNAPLDPFLDEIIYFENVKSCGTSTAQSLPCMFSKFGQSEFKPGTELYTENVLDVIQKSGYDVIWRGTNTGYCYGNCDRIQTEFYNDLFPEEDDLILLENFEEKIAELDNNILFLLHQQGSHGPAYYRRYSPEYEQFTPACQSKVIQDCTHEEFVNAYDNTIIYTSAVIAQTIEKLKAYQYTYNVMLLYISDHGESLGENGIYLHAMPYEFAPIEQIHVPMLIWLNEENAQNLKINREALLNKKGDALSHDNIFHSLLSITGISTEDYQKDLDLFEKNHN